MLTVIVNKSCATGLSSARPSSWAQSPSISQPLSWQALVIRPIVNKITGPYCIWRYCLLPCKFISWWAAKREEDEEENKEVKKKQEKKEKLGENVSNARGGWTRPRSYYSILLFLTLNRLGCVAPNNSLSLSPTFPDRRITSSLLLLGVSVQITSGRHRIRASFLL